MRHIKGVHIRNINSNILVSSYFTLVDSEEHFLYKSHVIENTIVRILHFILESHLDRFK